MNFARLLLTTFAVGLLFSEASLSHEECIHPPDRKAQMEALYKQILKDYFLGVTSYTIIPEFRDVLKNSFDDFADDVDLPFEKPRQLITKIYGESRCPHSSRTPRNQAPVTSCPHFVVMDVDQQRAPRSIAKAMCSCHRCLDVSKTVAKRTTNRCKPVNTYVPVIRWLCPKYPTHHEHGNYYRYMVDLEKVPVGCTCEMPTRQ